MAGYIFESREHGQYAPEEKVDPPVDVAAHNAAIAAAELERWKDKPDRALGYFVFPADRPHSFTPTAGFPYRCDVCKAERGLSPELCERSRVYRQEHYPAMTGAHVTIWTGEAIGVITSARVYTNNFGGRVVSMRVRGSNGASYYGRASWDNGTCINLRRSK